MQSVNQAIGLSFVPEATDAIIRRRLLSRKLAERYAFLERLSDEQARDIIALEDWTMLDSLATSIHYFYGVDMDITKRRLSDAMLDELMLFLVTRDDRDIVRLLYHHGDAIPEHFQKIYRKKYEELYPEANDAGGNGE